MERSRKTVPVERKRKSPSQEAEEVGGGKTRRHKERKLPSRGREKPKKDREKKRREKKSPERKGTERVANKRSTKFVGASKVSHLRQKVLSA